MCKCANGGHAMAEGQKFCGECGSKPAEAPNEGACGACSASMLKAARFCGECGSPALAPGEALDAAIDELEEFQKARLALTADLETLPVIDDDDLETPSPVDMLKANVGDDGTPTGDYDVLPVIDAMLKGQALGGRQTRAYAEHQLRMLGHLADGLGRMAKASVALAGHVRALDEKITGIGDQSRGRVALAGAALLEKPVAGRAPGAPGASGRTDLRGADLMVKCLVLGPEEGGLNSEEISTLEHYTNAGGGVPELLRDKRAALANRVTHVVERVGARQASAH